MPKPPAKRRRVSDSHPLHFSRDDLAEMSRVRDRWLDYNDPLECISVEHIQRATHDALRGAYAQLQWLWEQLEPADALLATCVERRLGALRRIPWDLQKKDNLSDVEDSLAEAQLRTLQDFANAIDNLDEGIAALARASFRHYCRLQLLETEQGELRLNVTDNWNWCRDGYRGAWQWNPAATFGLTRGEELPVPEESIITRLCPRPIDQPAMMLCLDRKNAKAQWLVFNGRYGVPPLFAIMPTGIDEQMRAQYIQFAAQCISNAAGVLPAGSDVKTVNPGATGPDTFSRLIEVANQEMVLRATGGLMTMLTAPGAGTNTDTGSAHQDAFDDLAAAEAEEIAALLNERLFAPVLTQWHPGQPQLVEFVMRRPDSDNASGTISNVAALAGAGYRTDADQVSELTGLDLTDIGAPSAAPLPGPGPSMAALHSARRRYAPAMLYPPARAAFERSLNSKLSAALRQPAKQAPAAPPLTPEELGALQTLAQAPLGLSAEALLHDAEDAYAALSHAIGQPAPDMEALPPAEGEHAANSSDKEECQAKDPSKCWKHGLPGNRHAREGKTQKQGTKQRTEKKSPSSVTSVKTNMPLSTPGETKRNLKSIVNKTTKPSKGKNRGLPGRGFQASGMDKEFYITNHSIDELIAHKHVNRSADPESHYTAAAMIGQLWEASEPVSQYRDKKRPYAKSDIEWMHKRKARLDIRGAMYDVEITAKVFKDTNNDPMLYQVKTTRRQ